MSAHTTIPPQAVEMVKHFEGCYLNAYRCPAGVSTIGYGHTAGVKMGDSISLVDAEITLARDLTEAAAQVDKLVTVPLNDEQRGALASFVFNLGAGSLKGSTLLKKLNAGDIEGASGEFGKWVYATVKGKKQVLPGLVKRREAERFMLLGLDWRDADAVRPAMPQRVTTSEAAKPLTQSVTVKAAVGGVATAVGVAPGIATGLGEMVEQVEQAKALRDGLAGLLPSNVTMAVVVALLLVTVGAVLWRRVKMAREGA